MLVAWGAITAVGTISGCESPDPLGTDPGSDALPLRPRFPVDGLANLDALPIVFDAQVSWTGGPPASTTRVRIAQQNDDLDLYLAIEWNDPTYDDQFGVSGTPDRRDGIRLQFDSDGDGRVGPGDDARSVYAAHGGAWYLDQHIGSSAAQGDPLDAGVLKDAIGDGLGRLSYDAATGTYTAEFLLPFADDLRGEDGIRTAATQFAVVLFDASSGAVGGRAAYPFGSLALDAEAGSWPRLDLEVVAGVARPGLPSNLSGLIAVLSEHEGPRRIYLFRPGSGDLARVPVDESLYVARLSLSHDRNWIALEASYSPGDHESYEIFRVSTDGVRLEQLTNNNYFDGAPSWGPLDTRIVYASERDEGNDGRRHASIVLMTPEGVEVDDLTPDVVDERDPAFLEDGRIVLKTTRASPWPRYRIAALRQSGAAFDILTEGLDGTDHHPASSGPWIYYERFRSLGDYSADPGMRSKSWDILSVHVLGGQGSTLVADGWANRFPAPDPTGFYVAYLRQSGHSYAELIGANGTFLGRLIPDVTEVVQLDWK